MFKIKHVFHSGFAIEFESFTILIDVFTHLDQFKGQEIYCFSTHAHGDHYTPKIFDLKKDNQVTFILSDDIQTQEEVQFVKFGDHLSVGPLQVEVFGTTDQGVSFKITYDNTVFFHSGDLNWWHWADNSLEKQASEKDQYQGEIQHLLGHNIDYAFVPVDHRLGSANRWAMDYFIEQIKPRYLIPMHFGDRYDSVAGLTTSSETRLLIGRQDNDYIL